MRKLLKFILLCLNIVIGAGLMVSAMTGLLNPEQHSRIVIASMTLPAWTVLALLALAGDFFVMRRGCLFMAFCLAVSFPQAYTVLPLNIPRGAVPQREKNLSWTLLSYNISNFDDLTEMYDGGVNPGVSYILATDADIVVLPEGANFEVTHHFHITGEQMDSLTARYPYIIKGNDILMMSKFPARAIELHNFQHQYLYGNARSSRVAAYMVDIHGRETAIFGCHLQSLGLTRDDKDLYEEFTRGEGLASKQELIIAKNDIIGKIGLANRKRAVAVDALVAAIDSIGCSNTIVCGDFNDTPCCYALRSLEHIGLREVYPLVGNGYMFTFNSDRLLFQIDHVLFKGIFRPWSMKRGSQRNSDHYPLVTTFIEA